jgi:hypothetical protein
VHELTATVTYTDPHRARMRFFQDMLFSHDVHWEVPTASTEAASQRAVGRYVADSQEDLEQFLTYVGSRLVFLIDWNRARKRLARFVKNTEAVALLKWAADHNVGITRSCAPETRGWCTRPSSALCPPSCGSARDSTRSWVSTPPERF